MIIKRYWYTMKKDWNGTKIPDKKFVGYFLLGIIPLYIKEL